MAVSVGPHLWAAALWGLFSSSAFTIGSIIGVSIKTSRMTRARVQAFGGGALMVASAIEVFAPKVRTVDRPPASIQWTTLGFGFIGAVVYAIYERALDGCMRRAEEDLLSHVEVEHGGAGVDGEQRERSPSTLSAYTQSPASAHASVRSPTVMDQSTELSAADAAHGSMPSGRNSGRISNGAGKQDGVALRAPLSPELRARKQASFMVWVGCFMDSIPESMVIGILANENDLGSLIGFILGVFLANLPGAMSAAEKMLLCGVPPRQIVLMWSAIMLWTSFGAFLGSLAFYRDGDDDKDFEASVQGHIEAALEGLAGGQLLSLVSNTIFPEAFAEAGSKGSTVGLFAMMGFLTVLTVIIIVQDTT